MKKFYNLKKGEDGTISAVGTTEIVDRDGDIVRAAGMDIKNYKNNPVIMFAHNWSDMPVGKAIDIKKDKSDIIFNIEFAETEEGQKVKYLIDNGFINSTSIGFIPKKTIWKDEFESIKEIDEKWYSENSSILKNARRVIWDAELLELSIVPIPANPNAQIVMQGKGLTTCAFKSPNMTVEESDDELLIEIPASEIKKAVPFKDTPIATDMKWSKSDALKTIKGWATDSNGNISMTKYRQAFAWYDAENADNLTAYKLPHHTIVDENLVAVWRGVTSAMAALLGARGGVDIPEGDRKAVYNHLAKHYKKNNVEAPKFKEYTLEDAVMELDNDTLEDMMKYFTAEDIKSIIDKKEKLEIEVVNIKAELESLQKSLAPSDESDADNSNEEDVIFEVEGISSDELKSLLNDVTFAHLKSKKNRS